MPRIGNLRVSAGAPTRRGTATLDDHALVELCREGDLDACREFTARHAPAGLRVAYLLTGSRPWALDLTRGALLATLLAPPGTSDGLTPGEALMLQIGRRWLALAEGSGADHRADEVGEAAPKEPDRLAAARGALARFDEHQRGALVLHDYAGLPVEPLAELYALSPDLIYSQIVRTRDLFRQAAGLERGDDHRATLAAIAFDAPREALWPSIEAEVRAGFERQQRRRRLLNAGAVAAALLLLLVGGFLLSRPGDGDRLSGDGREALAVEPTAPRLPFRVLPTATATPMADVGSAILVYSGDRGGARTGLFQEAAAVVPLLDPSAVEAGPPIVSPDGELILTLWYDYHDGAASAFVTAWERDLTARRWQAIVTTDGDAAPGERPDVKITGAVDHRHVYVARHPWTGGEMIEIDVLDRVTGALLETIATNLAGFAAAEVWLAAPPGLDQVHLFAINGPAPAESGAFTITFLAYRVPGGEKIHGRILHDQPDSRSFFLYESQLVAGQPVLFGVEYTSHYRQLAVHFFDPVSGRILPRVVLPFQPVADPLPYQQAISNDGHWLYVLSPATLEVAVVNLFDRSLVGVVPLDPGVLAPEQIGVQYLQSHEMQLSPDGSRLYALGTGAASASGVWVIDVGSWTVVDHLLPEARPAELLLSGDGRTLYLRGEENGVASGEGELLAIDTASGDAHPLEAPGAGRYSLASIATLYRRTYAVSPAVDGLRAEGSPAAAPLATARVELAPTRVTAGDTVSVEVRFVHPLTGEPVAEGSPGARFEEPLGVRLTLELDGGSAAVILELGRAGYGHYRGFVRLGEPGRWTARLNVDWPDGGPVDRSLAITGGLKIAPVSSASGATANASGG